MRPAAHCNIPFRALVMRTKHACAQPMPPGCNASIRTCICARSRAHCLCTPPICANLPLSTNKARTRNAGARGARALQGALKHPSARPLSAGNDAWGHLVRVQAQLCFLAPICAKWGKHTAVESRAGSRARLLARSALSTAGTKGSGVYGVFYVLGLSRYAHRRYTSQMLKTSSAASSMTIVGSGLALDFCDVRQGGDVSPAYDCSAAARHRPCGRRGRRRGGGLPKKRARHRSLIPGLATLGWYAVMTEVGT